MHNTGIVTGAASGIGLETSKSLLASGWTIYGIDHDNIGLQQARDTIENPNFIPMDCNIQDAENFLTVLENIQNESPLINILVACAGVLRLGPLEEMSLEEFDLVFDVPKCQTNRLMDQFFESNLFLVHLFFFLCPNKLSYVF